MKAAHTHIPLYLAVLIGTAASPSGVGLELEDRVLSSGGGSSRSASFQLEGSIGQPIAEAQTSVASNARLRTGFWSQAVRWLNSAPVAREDMIERQPGQTARVLIRTLLHNDSGTDLEGLHFVTVAAASARGGQVRHDGTSIFYEPSATDPSPSEDSFVYTARDDLGVLTTGKVRVRVVGIPPGLNVLQVGILDGPPPVVRVHFEGVAGRSYTLQAAPNISGPWSTSATLVAGSDGMILHTERLTAAPRFYRTVEPNVP